VHALLTVASIQTLAGNIHREPATTQKDPARHPHPRHTPDALLVQSWTWPTLRQSSFVSRTGAQILSTGDVIKSCVSPAGAAGQKQQLEASSTALMKARTDASLAEHHFSGVVCVSACLSRQPPPVVGSPAARVRPCA
jgi:hypothetical protein